MTRHAIIEHKTNLVVNCVEWHGAEWLPPRNHLVVNSQTADIGDIYDPETGIFTKTNLPQPDQE